MRQITFTDVRTRLRGLQEQPISNRIYTDRAFQLLQSKKPHEIIRFTESVSKSNYDIPFYMYIQLFEAVAENGNKSDIEKMSVIITEEIVHKVRDAKQASTTLKARISRAQNKISNSINKATANLYNNFTKAINKGVQKITPTYSQPSKDNSQTVSECYQGMLEKLHIMNSCDRVIENYNKISKRFNLDSLFIENSRCNGIGDTVVELCNLIDTYNMPSSVKFNTVIEIAWYGFTSNAIEFSKSEILESAVDYFLFKPDGLNACTTILESTLFYDKNNDIPSNIDILMEDEPEEEEATENIEESVMLWNSTKNTDYFNRGKKKVLSESNFEDLFNKFKQEELPNEDKPETKLRGLINKLYARNVDSIIDGTPELLQWIRRFFILGSGAIPVIGPVIMIIGFIADKFISLHFERDEVPKMIKCFNNEIKASKNKLKTVENAEEKDRLNKYIKSLEDAKEKLDNYYTELLSEKEQEERYDNMEDIDLDDISDYDDDFKDFFDDDEFDFDDDELLESAALRFMVKNTEEFINNSSKTIITEANMYDLVFQLMDDDLINVAKITARYPDTFYKDSIIDGIKDMLEDIKRNKIEFESIIAKATRTTALRNALEILTTCDNNDGEICIYGAIANSSTLNEAYRAVSIMIDTYSSRHHLLENSIMNTINMASMKLKNALTKMKDKEKSISRSIDVNLNSFRKSIERSLTTDNREAVIKGSILPSASKMIKMCIVNIGLVALHQPLLAIITTLGYIATSAKFKAKERQMVVDEIDIELKMCERYINIAEQKNDMKAYKQLLTTQKELERQKQRIKYKMDVDFNQKYTDSTSVGSGKD